MLKELLNAQLAYRLRWKRRRLLFRCLRKRRQLLPLSDKAKDLRRGGVRAFLCARNEADRLPHWLDHHRRLGVEHFFCVVHDSEDTTAALLTAQSDCSVWTTDASYKAARFGVDWIGWLLYRYGHGAWCLTLDADELFVYPGWTTCTLPQLTAWLDATHRPALAAPLLDLYPKGALGDQRYVAGQDPLKILTHYDAWNTTHILQPKHQNQWIQGGPRARIFFAKRPERAPTLNKIPLVKWRRSYVYVTSTHILLPRFLNAAFDARKGLPVIGCLLHTKFLDSIITRSADPKHRAEHFENSSLYGDYYAAIVNNPTLWYPDARPYRGEAGLIEDGIFWETEWGGLS